MKPNDAYTPKYDIFGPDNSLSPDWYRSIIYINAGLLLMGTNFCGIKMHRLSYNKLSLKCRWPIGGHFVSASVC